MLDRFLLKRWISTSRTLRHKIYDPSNITAPSALSSRLEFLKQRPDPVPMPKYTSQPLADGSTFHTFVQRKPLYAYIPANTPKSVWEKAMPPECTDRMQGKFPGRVLGADEQQALVQRYLQGGVRVKQVAEEFRCAAAQASKLIRRAVGKERRSRGGYKWYKDKKYASAQ